jgi:(E)-4-hydroxy-3-methylbut-2-enyl-diphosphate synthase
MSSYAEIDKEDYKDAGFQTNIETGEIVGTDSSADLIIASGVPENIPGDVKLCVPYGIWSEQNDKEKIYPVYSPLTFHESTLRSEQLNILQTGSDLNIDYLKESDPETTLVIFTFDADREIYAAEIFLNLLEENNLKINVVLNPLFHENELEGLRIKASSLLGSYVIDKRVSGISISNIGKIKFRDLTSTAFSILQCTETRITRTIYLSCPTCGRTKFNLQESVRKVKEATGHLKGLKIAVMGCIVNGPGEMAGADYGYVGAATGKVHIYRGTDPILKNIPEKDAVEEMLMLIEKDQTSL